MDLWHDGWAFATGLRDDYPENSIHVEALASIDLRTPGERSRQLRDDVVADAEVQCAQG